MNISAALALVGAFLAAAPEAVGPPTPADAARVAKVQAVLESSTKAWSAHFQKRGRAYRQPRLTMVRIPMRHPARGSGYSVGVGLLIDLSDVEAIERVFGKDADTLIGLMVAHEVGHHAQALDIGGSKAGGVRREIEADCYAGWWLARANAEAPGSFPIPDLRRRMPEMLSLLSTLRVGRFVASDPRRHGSYAERHLAVRRGLSATSPEACRTD